MKCIKEKGKYLKCGRLIPVASFLCFLFIQTFLTDKVYSGVEQDETAKPDKEAEAAAKKPDINISIVAELNGLRISTHDLLKRYNLFLFMSGSPSDYSERVSVNSYLENYMAELLLLQEAKRQKISAGKDEIGQERKKYLDRNLLTEAEFLKRLDKARLTTEDADKYFENNVTAYKLGIARFGAIDIPDNEAKKYYDRNYDHFNGPERVALSHILICHTESTGCRSDLNKQEAKEFAVNLRKSATPENFAKLAKQYSSDRTGDDGGSLGFITRGSAVPAIETVAFSLEKGGISDVVETEYGFHILYVTARQKARSTTFKGAKETIKRLLKEEHIASRLFNYSGELLKTADIKRYGDPDKAIEAGAKGSWAKAEKGRSSGEKRFQTFKNSGLKLNLNSKGQPVILFFSSVGCSHCAWISETFDTVAIEYMQKGFIEAHHYEMTSRDDILTPVIEKEIPKEYLKYKQERSPDSVPYFNFGGIYERVGTGYEALDDFFAEELEMRQVIDALLGAD
jgi:parvulin-like peptidyl-prolyl isomerase/thiol-disulfide isomerase/thioredoxin